MAITLSVCTWQDRLVQADSGQPRYSAYSTKVVSLVEAVRRRPGMYFGLSREDPRLMAAVARLAAMEPFTLAKHAPVQVTLTVESDISFTVEDDLPPLAGTDGRPRPGIDDSLIDRRRWELAAIAALSTHVTIEVRTSGRAWRQEFAYPESPSAIREHRPSETIGTRATFTLDSAYFAPGSSLPADATAARDADHH